MELDQEVERLKLTFVETQRQDGYFQPMLVLHRKGEHVASMVVRGSDGQADKELAITEACSLIPHMGADEVAFAFDSWAHHDPSKRPSEQPDATEGLVILLGQESGLTGTFIPYERDEEGSFAEWGERTGDVDTSILSGSVVATFGHFMTSSVSKKKYLEPLLVTLRRRGHIIHVHDIPDVCDHAHH